MTRDKKLLYAISIVIFLLLLLALFIPFNSRLIACLVLIPLGFVTCYFVRKRSILSINTKQVTMLVGVIGALYVIIVFLTGIYFGFGTLGNAGFSIDVIFNYTLPIAFIIIASEIIRRVLLAQNSRSVTVLCYFSFVVADVLISTNIYEIQSFNNFMDVLAGAFFPACIANFVFNYLSKRYGAAPNIVYRLITVLYYYIIPIHPVIPDALLVLIKLLVPLFVYGFISILYEKKRKYALKRGHGKIALVLGVLVIGLMISIVMLISCQFKYGAIVIATESMTGEINKGDAVIYEQYNGQTILEGQVIVFKKNQSRIVHRVVDIKIENGVKKYFTKGDANDNVDFGFITDSEIVGIVGAKVPYVGYPTLWLRNLVEKGVN